MDLIPKPDQVVAAAGNLAHKLLYGGLADLRPMPRALVDEGVLREVYHYRPAEGVEDHGDPVLLVTPLAAPSLCFDLRRGCSLVEHLVGGGRPTYLVEYGQVSFRNRTLGIEHWVEEVVPAAVEAASRHAGGRPVHLVGWSLGGIFALLAAADRPDLPIASVTAVGSPVDVSKVPLVAPMRPLLNLTGGTNAITRAYRALGGVPKPLVGWAFQLASVQKMVTKPLAIAVHLDDAEFLAQIEAVERFSANMLAYPGRSFGQLYHRFVRGNALAGGGMEIAGRTVSLADVTVPVLVVAGATDGIAPLPSVRAILPLLSGSPEVQFEIVPGGHLGMLTGRAARTTTWATLEEWLDRWESAAPPAPRPARRTPARAAKRTPAKTAATTKGTPAKTAASKRTASKTAATKGTPSKTAASKRTPTTAAATKRAPRKTAATKQAPTPTRETIGSNPGRRYGSSNSRALAR